MRNHAGKLAAALFFLGVLCPGIRSSHADTAIVGARVIDVRGGSVSTPSVVRIEGERIVAIEPLGSAAVSADDRVVSAHGQYLIPGLVDMHAHAAVPTCARSEAGVRFAGFDESLSERLLATLLHHGITTARSPSTPPALGVRLRDSILAGERVGPELIVAGEFINDAGLDDESLRRLIRGQAETGVDAIKLYTRLGPSQVERAVAEAYALGLPAIGHLQATSWQDALGMGIDALTHVSSWSADLLPEGERDRYRRLVRKRGAMAARIDWMESVQPAGPEIKAVISMLAERGVSLDPTLVAFDTKFSFDAVHGRAVGARYREHSKRDVVPGLVDVWETCGVPTDHWSRSDFMRARAAWPNLLGLVRAYHEGGVLLTAGSDTPNAWVIPGVSLHQELRLLGDAGISTTDVLRIATLNAARALGLEDEIGSVEVEKRADLVILNADPTADIANTADIAGVIQRGRMVER